MPPEPRPAAEPVLSRRWTGPEAEPPLDHRVARAAFLAAGGTGAAAPQRAAARVSWIGLPLMTAAALLGAGDRALPLALSPPAARLREAVEAALRPGLGLKGAEGMAALLGDTRILAVLLALAGALAGIAAARRHRAALRRGFDAAEAGTPRDAAEDDTPRPVFRTRHAGLLLPLLMLPALHPPAAGGTRYLLEALLLWLFSRLAAAGLCAVAERRAAGLGAGAAAPSGWAAAELLLSLGALLLILFHLLGASWLSVPG